MNTTAKIRAFEALKIPLRDVSWWSCDAPVYRFPSPLPAEVTDWISRHPEARAESRGRRDTADSLESWRVRFNSIQYVLEAPKEYRNSSKKKYADVIRIRRLTLSFARA